MSLMSKLNKILLFHSAAKIEEETVILNTKTTNIV